jgi:hypothetical protein
VGKGILYIEPSLAMIPQTDCVEMIRVSVSGGVLVGKGILYIEPSLATIPQTYCVEMIRASVSSSLRREVQALSCATPPSRVILPYMGKHD